MLIQTTESLYRDIKKAIKAPEGTETSFTISPNYKVELQIQTDGLKLLAITTPDLIMHRYAIATILQLFGQDISKLEQFIPEGWVVVERVKHSWD
jgi:predicted patatin/cPLA2 family phospholipase